MCILTQAWLFIHLKWKLWNKWNKEGIRKKGNKEGIRNKGNKDGIETNIYIYQLQIGRTVYGYPQKDGQEGTCKQAKIVFQFSNKIKEEDHLQGKIFSWFWPRVPTVYTPADGSKYICSCYYRAG